MAVLGTVRRPGWDSPFNLGSHCAQKVASFRETRTRETRLNYPMKKKGWPVGSDQLEQAINEIGDKMNVIREGKRPDSVYCRSAKHNTNRRTVFPQVRGLLGHKQRRPPRHVFVHSTRLAGACEHIGATAP